MGGIFLAVIPVIALIGAIYAFIKHRYDFVHSNLVSVASAFIVPVYPLVSAYLIIANHDDTSSGFYIALAMLVFYYPIALIALLFISLVVSRKVFPIIGIGLCAAVIGAAFYLISGGISPH